MINDNHQRVPLLAMSFLTFVAPLYFQPNWGGRGLELTFNISVWAVAITFVCYSAIGMVNNRGITLSNIYLAICAAPIMVIIVGLITGSSQPISFLFREIYIVGGILFFFSLFQYKLSQRTNDRIIFVIATSAIIQGSIGVTQIFWPETIQGWLPTSTDRLPRGIFQQINAQASYMATCLAAVFYLASRPFIRQSSLLSKALLIVAVGFSSFIVFYSSSRVGLISTAVSILTIITFRHKQLLQHKSILALITIALIVGGIFGNSGVSFAAEKFATITHGITGSVRINIYSIALQIFLEKPFTGHGIGNFLNIWTAQSG